MNLKHELAKIYKTCVLEDIFFGYEIEDKDNYFMLKLDPKYCKLVGISDGCIHMLSTCPILTVI